MLLNIQTDTSITDFLQLGIRKLKSIIIPSLIVRYNHRIDKAWHRLQPLDQDFCFLGNLESADV